MERFQFKTADGCLEILPLFAVAQAFLSQHQPKPTWIMKDDSLFKANDYIIRCSN